MGLNGFSHVSSEKCAPGRVSCRPFCRWEGGETGRQCEVGEFVFLIQPGDHPFAERKVSNAWLEGCTELFRLSLQGSPCSQFHIQAVWFPGGLSTTCNLIAAKINQPASLRSSTPMQALVYCSNCTGEEGRAGERQRPLQGVRCPF